MNEINIEAFPVAVVVQLVLRCFVQKELKSSVVLRCFVQKELKSSVTVPSLLVLYIYICRTNVERGPEQGLQQRPGARVLARANWVSLATHTQAIFKLETHPTLVY